MILESIQDYVTFKQYIFEYRSDNTLYYLPFDVYDESLSLCDIKRRVYMKYIKFDYPIKDTNTKNIII